MTAMGGWPGRWRTRRLYLLLLLILTAVAACGPPAERLRSGAYASAPRAERLSVAPPPRCKPLGPEVRGNFVRWSRDGSFVVFHWEDKLYQAAADGSAVRLIDTEPTVGWHAFGLSPDGRQIVYSGCQIKYISPRYGVEADRYELVRANIDGTWSRRLAVDYDRGIFPSWSPDGTRIAFHSANSGLIVKSVDDSRLREREIVLGAAWLDGAPQWSPDSARLAVTMLSRGPRVQRFRRSPAVYTVGADGSDPRRLVSGVVSAPSWSPDGQWLAYARVSGGEVILAAIRGDGTDERQVTTIEGWHRTKTQSGGRADNPRQAWIRTLAWSPDGAHLLYSCFPQLCVVTWDGRPVGRTSVLMPGGSMGAWSPDGTRIAVAGPGPGDPVLYTMTPDGGQRCPLARVNTQYAPTRNVVVRLWRRIFGLEAEYRLVAVRDCAASA